MGWNESLFLWRWIYEQGDGYQALEGSFNSYLATFFVLRMLLLFTSAAYIFKCASGQILLWKQTLWILSSSLIWAPCCLQYRLLKYLSRKDGKRQKLWVNTKTAIFVEGNIPVKFG